MVLSEVESHAVVAVTRPPVLLPSPVLPLQDSVFRRPTLGGVINTDLLSSHSAAVVSTIPSMKEPTVLSTIPSMKGPLLTPPFNKLEKLRLTRGSGRGGARAKPREQCGVTPAFGETRIMGGSEARLGQFPWVGYLSIKGPNIDKMCGASLVSTRCVAESVSPGLMLS